MGHFLLSLQAEIGMIIEVLRRGTEKGEMTKGIEGGVRGIGS